MRIFLSFITNWSEPFSYLLYFIAILIYYRHDKTTKIMVLLFYYMLAFLLMSIASYNVYFQEHNIWAYNLMFLLAPICIFYYFFQITIAPPKKIIVKFFIFINAGYFLLTNFILNKLHTFNSLGYALFYASSVLMVLMYYHQILKNVNEEKIFLNFHFWMCSSYLLNFLGGFFVILSYSYLTNKILQNKIQTNDIIKDEFLLTELWAFPNSLLLLSSMILIFGTLWITYHKKLR